MAATCETLEGTDRSKRVRLAERMRKRSCSLISNRDLRKVEGFDTQDVVGEGKGGRRNDARGSTRAMRSHQTELDFELAGNVLESCTF